MSKHRRYDLEERTAVFGENVISFCKGLQLDYLTRPLAHQLIRAATSVGANYCEADNAQSSRDFVHKISICKKESRESMHFLRMCAHAQPESVEHARVLWKEAKELNSIFNTIYRKVRNKQRSGES